MNYRQLYYFVTIVESGNITAAAKKLELSQPPLSKQIMALEEELGIKLMERSSRKITLTDAGFLMYQRAKSIISMMETTADEMTHFEQNQQGVLRLGTISSCGSSLLKDCLVEFCALYPHVTFEICEDNTYELLEKLKKGMIETAIVRTSFNSDGFECIYGKEEPLVAVGKSELLPQNGKDTISLEELSDLPLNYYRRFEHIILPAFQNRGLTPNFFCKSDDARTPLMWAQAGLGVAVVPRSICQLFASDGLTVVKTIDCGEFLTKMAAVYKKDGYISKIGRTFVTFWGKRN